MGCMIIAGDRCEAPELIAETVAAGARKARAGGTVGLSLPTVPLLQGGAHSGSLLTIGTILSAFAS